MATAVVTLSVAGEPVAHGTHVKALVPVSDLRPLWAAAAEERATKGVAAAAAAGPGGRGDGQQQRSQRPPPQRSRL
jgi:hypothetical protein